MQAAPQMALFQQTAEGAEGVPNGRRRDGFLGEAMGRFLIGRSGGMSQYWQGWRMSGPTINVAVQGFGEKSIPATTSVVNLSFGNLSTRETKTDKAGWSAGE